MSSPMKLTSSASFSPSIRISLRLRIHQAQAKNFCRVLDIRVAEDMTARAVGINVFLLTDCLINKEHEDINQYPRGSYEQLLNYIENLK